MNTSNVTTASQYVFAYQPIVRSFNHKVVAYELLLRQFHSLNKTAFLDEPALFCDNLNELMKCKAKTMKHLMINEGVEMLFINLTPDQVAHPHFSQYLLHFYNEGIAPSSLALEVTEQDSASDLDSFYKNLHSARANGHPIVVDDFGVGVSNFCQVQKLRPSIVKTDKSLLNSALNDEYCLSFLKNLINFLRQIGCRVVIEGVETERHLEIANLCQSDYMQGYHFGLPINISSDEHDSLNHEDVVSKRFLRLVAPKPTSSPLFLKSV